MVLLACKEETAMVQNLILLKNIPQETWQTLAGKKIYFGHQSVGYNIIDGVKAIMREDPDIKLNIVKTSDPSVITHGAFVHSEIGNNTDPQSKIESFEQVMGSGMGEKVDIAFFKFCYVDIDPQMDIQTIFSRYKDSITQLREKYPHVKFIHITVPLEGEIVTWKVRINRLLGRVQLWDHTKNIKRNEYNDLLRKEYAGKEPIYDLAELESTYPDGKRCAFMNSGRQYYSLVAKYTFDGGHLNELGKKRAAENLLLTLISTM